MKFLPYDLQKWGTTHQIKTWLKEQGEETGKRKYIVCYRCGAVWLGELRDKFKLEWTNKCLGCEALDDKARYNYIRAMMMKEQTPCIRCGEKIKQGLYCSVCEACLLAEHDEWLKEKLLNYRNHLAEEYNKGDQLIRPELIRKLYIEERSCND